MTPNTYLVNHHFMSYRLEKSHLFWFEDILFCQKIYAIVCGFLFIAEIEFHKECFYAID